MDTEKIKVGTRFLGNIRKKIAMEVIDIKTNVYGTTELKFYIQMAVLKNLKTGRIFERNLESLKMRKLIIFKDKTNISSIFR